MIDVCEMSATLGEVAAVVVIATLSTLSTLVLSFLSYSAWRARAMRRSTPAAEPARKVFLVRLGLPQAGGSRTPSRGAELRVPR